MDDDTFYDKLVSTGKPIYNDESQDGPRNPLPSSRLDLASGSSCHAYDRPYTTGLLPEGVGASPLVLYTDKKELRRLTIWAITDPSTPKGFSFINFPALAMDQLQHVAKAASEALASRGTSSAQHQPGVVFVVDGVEAPAELRVYEGAVATSLYCCLTGIPFDLSIAYLLDYDTAAEMVITNVKLENMSEEDQNLAQVVQPDVRYGHLCRRVVVQEVCGAEVGRGAR